MKLNFNKLFTAVLIGTVLGVGGFFLTSFVNGISSETKQDMHIKQNKETIDSNLKLNKEKNKAVNYRMSKHIDKNATDHKHILNKVDTVQRDVNHIKINLAKINTKIDIILNSLNLAQNE